MKLKLGRWFLLLCYLFMQTAFAVTVYPIGEFSKDYSATVTVGIPPIESDYENGNSGYISVFDKSGKEILRSYSDNLHLEITDGKVHANIKQLPYGEQSVLLFDDVNFDGLPDLALRDGDHSCYSGPSYQIYLAQKDGSFKLNDKFTELAQTFCGMFDVDPENKLIETMTKGGCCWHQFNTYSVNNNKPILIKSIEEDFIHNDYLRYKTHHYKNGKVHTELKQYIADHGNDGILYSFNLLNHPEKQAIIFDASFVLDYALIKEKNGEVEYSVFLAENHQLSWQRTQEDLSQTEFGAELPNKPQVHYQEGKLSFHSGNTVYSIIDDGKRLGVEVRQGNKVTFIKGDPKTKQGSLKDIINRKFANYQ